uniref:CFA20 domain-containing protein n=1 Tax=Timema monikensis TaxID=170555 RepID=A0A7R9EJC2_9NEOP|nr:unnamed protein product [Timema monikensis]
MFQNTFQSGFLSILYSCGSRPLAIWGQKVRNGHIKRITDQEVKSLVLELAGTNVATTYIYCPPDPKGSLAIKLPFLVMILKNMNRYFTFEIQVVDDKDMRRRFRVSNYQSTTRVRPFTCTMPIGLNCGWNQVQFNLADFTRRAYGTNYIETRRIQIHANCRIRRIYFSDRLYSEDELPADFKLYVPSSTGPTKPKSKVPLPPPPGTKKRHQEQSEHVLLSSPGQRESLENVHKEPVESQEDRQDQSIMMQPSDKGPVESQEDRQDQSIMMQSSDKGPVESQEDRQDQSIMMQSSDKGPVESQEDRQDQSIMMQSSDKGPVESQEDRQDQSIMMQSSDKGPVESQEDRQDQSTRSESVDQGFVAYSPENTELT